MKKKKHLVDDTNTISRKFMIESTSEMDNRNHILDVVKLFQFSPGRVQAGRGSKKST